MKHLIEVKETLTKLVVVEETDQGSSELLTSHLYNQDVFRLDSDNYLDTEFHCLGIATESDVEQYPCYSAKDLVK